MSFLQSSILTKFVCLFTSSLTSHILRLLLTKVATTSKLFSLLISYFRNNVLRSLHHNLPLIAEGGSVHAIFCVAFFLEHLSCFNKSKQGITQKPFLLQ